MVNVQELQGSWNQIRGQLKKKWGQLTDDDLSVGAGNVDMLVGRIQQKTGESREAIERFLSSAASGTSSAVSQAAETAREYAQQAGSYVRSAGDRMREGYGHLADEAREQVDRAQDVVRHNPAESLAVAFGFGIALGLVVGMAVRSR
jgi:uncharacterized protein YjbJ (UPF0337 family)